MRRAHFDTQWLFNQDSSFAGIALGYDRCAEHEWGVAPLLNALGVNLPKYPLGVEDRKITVAPSTLRFVEYKAKPQDKRRKSYPAAMLVLDDSDEPIQPAEVGRLDATFYGESGPQYPNADIAASWDRDGFCINVRGELNVEHLRELYNQFVALNISTALPHGKVFAPGGLSFVITNRMDEAAKADVLDRDQAHKELSEAAEATGIEATLKQAGRGWYALSPAWLDSAKKELVFFLNPERQGECNHGWFTVQELTEWAQGTGPVFKDAALIAHSKRPEHHDYGYRLVDGLAKQGLYIRFSPKLVWFDEAKTIPGLKVLAAEKSRDELADGIYAFDEFVAKYASPLKEPVAA